MGPNRSPVSASLSTSDVQAVLSETFGAGRWQVSRTRSGWTGRSFVASNGGTRLFLKIDVAASALRRLAELGVAPQVLHAGEYLGRSFVIQPYVGGRHPHRGWFEGHMRELARIVRAYQNDTELRDLRASPTVPTHREHVNEVIDHLEQRWRRAAVQMEPTDDRFGHAIGELRRRSVDLESADLVPTHGDPNRKNFILADSVYVVDWDDLALSDAMRDIGQLLWWYVPTHRWDVALDLFGVHAGEAVRERIYWWVAAESLDVALTLVERGQESGAGAFLNDFAAAIEQRRNPRARS